MARKDIIHDVVKSALETDGWTITDDPFYVKIEGGRGLEIDLGAEKLLAAEKGSEKIVVEIKSFIASVLHSFHQTLGQYLDYRDALEESNINRDIFIALPEEAYNKINSYPFILRRIEKYDLKIIVIDVKEKKIAKWKK